ncbi:NAD-dependent epimerase/dehydratase family protein [Rhodococcus sp. IEGM 1366]|uniref:NAD-dependent epimerase/dehydratase family protein n=1 Tax=Rhodococcus sp. IEGM 1366 TaxID=3082223 RepID=UPI0029549674|nr:NAD-dependent epimerase/dehydratase family protein [Rhodococcus sp. IEGM 1366]MDV8071003.1 NAD-dependent epimerase/dehydratase family protein [Rhodococcus sp. IEGM 1366]
MSTVLVTGGTGLIGANICLQLREIGHDVRALVRPGSDYQPLLELGVQPQVGDITSPEDVLQAVDGAEYIIHSAAVLGGASQDPGEHERVNTGGIANVLDSAEKVGVKRTVALGTTTYFDYVDQPLTEKSTLLPQPPTDPYSVSKRAAFVELMRRAEEGLDACVVIPGGTFGPSPVPARAMVPPSYNLRIALALRGELDQDIHFPIPWSYAEDVATCAIAALERGVRGEKYLAFASPEDVTSTAEFLNCALEIAGRNHRIVDITAAELDRRPELEEQVGLTLASLARRKFPEPYFSSELTRKQLSYDPLRLDEALRRTVDWIQEVAR